MINKQANIVCSWVVVAVRFSAVGKSLAEFLMAQEGLDSVVPLC